MYMKEETLDDMLRRVLSRLLSNGSATKPSRGPAFELAGVLLQITNPRARLSRTEQKGKLFSCLGELLWYLAGTNSVKYISYYIPKYKEFSDDGKTIHGAYGPRLFSMAGANQVANVTNLLRENPFSRRAAIQLFHASDIVDYHKDVPCTCSLQFMIRRGKLNMYTYMRSNDAFIGLPHDIFAFTMLQELVARTLQVGLGTYKHFVGSLHLYQGDRLGAQQYVEEGWQETVLMPEMPLVDPWRMVRRVLKAESTIRRGKDVDVNSLGLNNYWGDIVRLLQIFSYSKSPNNRSKEIANAKRQMSSRIYDPYIDQRRKMAAKRQLTRPVQEELF